MWYQVQQYLRLVVEGKLPVNHDIVYELQVHPILRSTRSMCAI